MTVYSRQNSDAARCPETVLREVERIRDALSELLTPDRKHHPPIAIRLIDVDLPAAPSEGAAWNSAPPDPVSSRTPALQSCWLCGRGIPLLGL